MGNGPLLLNLRTRRSAMNYVASVGVSVASLAIGFIVTPYLVWWLGHERYGAARAVADWFGHFSILEAGVAGALAPMLASALGRNDRHSLRRALHAGMRAYMVAAGVALVIAAVLTANAGRLVPVDPSLTREVNNAFFVGLLSCGLMMLTPFQTLADAAQRGYVVSTLSFGQGILASALSLLFAHEGWGIPGQLAAIVLAQGAFRLGLVLATQPLMGGVLWVLAEPPDKETQRALWKLNPPSFLNTLAGRLGFYSDNIVIALMIGPAHVMPFFITQRLASVAGTQLLGVGNASWAAMAELHTLGRREDFNARLLELTRLVGGLAIAALIPIAAYNGAFVTRWVGPEAFAGDWLTAVACLNAYLLALLALWGWCFGGTGKLGVVVPVTLTSALLNIAVSIGATWRFGLIGPLIGTLAAAVLVNIWAIPLLLHRHFGTSIPKLLGSALLPVLWGAPLGAITLWLSRRYPPSTLVPLLSEMAAAGLVLLICWWFLALRSAEREAFRERVRAVLRA